jgi:hypothetical protein
MTEIYIPLASSGGVTGEDWELRMMLRSLERFWQGDYRVTLFGRAPAWLDTDQARVIPAGPLREAWLLAAETGYRDGTPWLWWYDDCWLMRESGPEDFERPRAGGCLRGQFAAMARSRTRWRRELLSDVVRACLEDGRPARDFSTPHAPMMHDARSVLAALARFGERWSYKWPVETWLGNDGRPWQGIADVDGFFGSGTRMPREDARIMVRGDEAMTPGFRAWLSGRLPEPSRYELAGEQVPETGLREWWDDRGRRMMGEFCEVAGDRVILQMGGSRVPVSLARLSGQDRAWIAAQGQGART